MKERLQKILSGCGVASRRGAERMICAGRVCVNGRTAALGDSADPACDEITVDGKKIRKEEKRVYLMLNKPRGFVTTMSDEKGRKTAAQLVADCGTRVYPVGRLDMDSEGLLLFTNDGEFANFLMHPKHEVRKIYHVLVSGYGPDSVRRLREPMELDGVAIRTPQVKILRSAPDSDQAGLEISIHEGRNRQVRRMCAQAGMKVLRLTRVAEGNLRLGGLPRGSWRYLTEDEVASLKK